MLYKDLGEGMVSGYGEAWVRAGEQALEGDNEGPAGEDCGGGGFSKRGLCEAEGRGIEMVAMGTANR